MTDKKYIALTFDDGPDPEMTPLILDLLKKYGGKASFFLIGEQITPETEHLVRREFEEGHEINNHSFTHRDMTKFTDEEIRSEIEATDKLIFDIIGEHTKFFRPPFILYNDTMFDNIDLPFICAHGCNDWIPEATAEEREKLLLEHAYDGAMILLHDLKGNFRTYEAVKNAIPKLIEQGFEMCTLTKLFEVHGITPRSDINVIYNDVFDTVKD